MCYGPLFAGYAIVRVWRLPRLLGPADRVGEYPRYIGNSHSSLRGAERRSNLQPSSCLADGWRWLPPAFAGAAMTPYGCGRDNRRSSSGRRCRKGRASNHATLRSPPRLTIHVMLYYYKPSPDLTLRGTFANFRAADRSDERRVGKDGVSTCRSRRS